MVMLLSSMWLMICVNPGYFLWICWMSVVADVVFVFGADLVGGYVIWSDLIVGWVWW